MDATWTSQLGPFKGCEFICWQKLTNDRVRKGGYFWASRKILRVLVVDEDQDAADALIGLVRRSGHAGYLAYDGIAALRMAAAAHPNVVLLDLDMRDMDGCQVARHLRLDFSRNECFIIAVTDWADDESRQQCVEAGIDLLLIRPFDPEVVETLLMLEYSLVNRSQAENRIDSKVTYRVPCRESSAENSHPAARTVSPRMQPAPRMNGIHPTHHETGGSRC